MGTWTSIIPMSTEFAVEWKGFTTNEKRKLERLWLKHQFPPEFCSRFAAQIYKGAPGEAGGIFIQAKDLRVFRWQWTVELDFSSLEDLARLAATVVLDAANGLWYCNRCGRPAPVGRPCGQCSDTAKHALMH